METSTFRHLFICHLGRGYNSGTCRYFLSGLLNVLH
jgi:hypothetical protein